MKERNLLAELYNISNNKVINQDNGIKNEIDSEISNDNSLCDLDENWWTELIFDKVDGSEKNECSKYAYCNPFNVDIDYKTKKRNHYMIENDISEKLYGIKEKK